MRGIGYSAVGEVHINEQLEWELMRDDYLDKKLDRHMIALLHNFLLWNNMEDTIFF